VVKEHGSVSFNSKNGGGAPQDKLADGIQIGKMYIPFSTPLRMVVVHPKTIIPFYNHCRKQHTLSSQYTHTRSGFFMN
jgi:hypothetical protein